MRLKILRLLPFFAAVPGIIILFGWTAYIFMPPEEKYFIAKKSLLLPFNEKLEEAALKKRMHYLSRTIFLDDNVARTFVELRKHKGTDKENIFNRYFNESLEKFHDQKILKELETIASKMHGRKP